MQTVRIRVVLVFVACSVADRLVSQAVVEIACSRRWLDRWWLSRSDASKTLCTEQVPFSQAMLILLDRGQRVKGM